MIRLKHLVKFLMDVQHELLRAESMYPSNSQQLAAFHEESGEVAKALIDFDRGKETAEGVYKECVQAAAMAAAIALKGSGEFTYPGKGAA